MIKDDYLLMQSQTCVVGGGSIPLEAFVYRNFFYIQGWFNLGFSVQAISVCIKFVNIDKFYDSPSLICECFLGHPLSSGFC